MASFFATGCTASSDDDDDEDGGSSGSGTSGESGSPTSGSSGGTEEYSCCLNGSFFDCPSEDALLRCGNDFDPAECNRVESRDDECTF